MKQDMSKFHEHAHEYIGAPFIHRGRTEHGVDCVGLVILCAKDCGYDEYEEFVYGRQPKEADLLRVLKTHFGEPTTDKIKVNDVLLIKLKRGLAASHVGIVTTHPHGLGLIHCHARAGRVVYHRLTADVNVVAAYRWGGDT